LSACGVIKRAEESCGIATTTSRDNGSPFSVVAVSKE